MAIRFKSDPFDTQSDSEASPGSSVFGLGGFGSEGELGLGPLAAGWGALLADAMSRNSPFDFLGVRGIIEIPGARGAASPAATTTTSPPTLQNAGIAADVAKYEQNGSLSYSSMLTILEDAAVGGMTASKFSTLQTLAGELNATGGISVSAYVQQITDDVVDGNSANATWNGGASMATALGDLSAASTQTQANELIGMWFLGTNLPSLSVAAVDQENFNPTYQNFSLPLYGSGNAPLYTDVNQGYLGDCYFVSSLGETALKDPSAIEAMITSNGNGTYGVRFFVNGQPDYVTVNGELPVMGGGYEWANGSTLEFASGSNDMWVELVEKAYAQLNAQTAAPHGAELDSASDSYEGITAGSSSALTEITDQSVSNYGLSPFDSSSALASFMSTISAAWSAGEEVLMSTPNNSNGNLVGDHMYMVTNINSATETLTIHNPWNAAYSGSLAMTFNETLKQLAADGCEISITSGAAV